MDEECSNDDPLLDRVHIRIALMAVYVAIFAICLVGNLATLCVICANRSLRTATNFFLANLAVADLLVAAFCILQNMSHLVGAQHGNWRFGQTLCKLYSFVLHFTPFTSTGILVCISVERYFAVAHPTFFATRFGTKSRIFFVICVWTVSFYGNLPYFTTAMHIQFRVIKLATCTRAYDGLWFNTRNMVTMSFVFGYCVPLATICLLYARIGRILWSGTGPLPYGATTAAGNAPPHEMQEIANGNEPNNGDLPAQSTVPSFNCARAQRALDSRKRLIRMLIIVVSAFAILTLPHHARILHQVWSSDAVCNGSWKALLQPIAYLMLFASSACNPLIYALMNRRIRRIFVDFFRFRFA